MPFKLSPSILLLAILLPLFSSPVEAWPLAPEPARSANFPQCQSDILNHNLDYEPYWVNIRGERTYNKSEVVGSDLGTCNAYCGTSPSTFQWSSFSQQFTGWLLPFLALTAQLPYESKGTWHNLMCLFLTIGSPQLAMHSLALTILNSRYAKRLLDSLPMPRDYDGQVQLNELKASLFQAFRFSQQEPFGLAIRDAASLTDLTTVRSWWRCVQQSVNKSARWCTASLATQAAWAIIAFGFTWVDAFGSAKIGTIVTAFGLAVALGWSWVTVIVLGWFFAGVSLSRSPITEGIREADSAHPDAFPRLTEYARPETGQDPSCTALTRRIAGDVEHSGPIYNYAKVGVWSHMVYHTVETVRRQTLQPRPQQVLTVQVREMATAEQQQGPPEERHELQPFPTPAPSDVLQNTERLQVPQDSPQNSNRRASTVSTDIDLERGMVTLATARYQWEEEAEWKHDMHVRMVWSAGSAVLLNLMTVGASFGLDFSTPSVGLGCRSGGLLAYWMGSYGVMILLLLAAWISDLWSVHHEKMRHPQLRTRETFWRRALYAVLGYTAVLLRLLGKLLAVANSVWLILHSLFEFTGFYDRCFCLTNGGTSYWLWLDDSQVRALGNTERFWVGFASATGVTCLMYIAFMGVWSARRL